MESYKIAIVGAGPAGLSAAAHAAALDSKAGRATPSHVLLEGFGAHAKTIQRYQKGKHVMAEPGFLDLRSDVQFAAGTRENILEGWREDLARLKVNARFNAEVIGISGAKGAFTVQLSDGTSLLAEYVVLAIGLEGNPRKLGCPGDELDVVQYQLDDPGDYRDETIFVVGAGDSAIENAIALSAQNDVCIVNRGKEFSRAKEGNLAAVLAAISDDRSRLKCHYESSIRQLRRAEGAGNSWIADLQTPGGQVSVGCNRVIARLGAIAPRRFVESIGVQFPNDRADAIPSLSAEYESNVSGVYVIGALAGYPLIKQAINQGHDVVEFIHGNRIKPADHALLEQRFLALPYDMDADTSIRQFQLRIPMFRQLNALAFRELIIESEMIAAYPVGALHDEAVAKVQAAATRNSGSGRAPRVTRIIREGDTIYEPGEFGTSFYTIVDGEVLLEVPGSPSGAVKMGRGEFFGEMSLLSGRPRLERAVAGPACVVVETPRRTMVKLMNSNEEVREGIDWIFVVRELQRHFVPLAPFRELKGIAARVTSHQYKAGEVIYTEGEKGECLFVVRSGGIALTRRRDSADAMVAQVRAGEVIGQMALMGDAVRRESATTTVASELLAIRGAEFAELMQRKDAQLAPLQDNVSQRLVDNARMQVRPEAGLVMSFLMDQGLGEATDVLVIKEELCVGCDNCEKACAETHGGVSRLDRAAGATFAKVHIPVACRHCEQPHCMKDCPPNAIRRSETGEVYIDETTCIGCGNCESNCPYDVIKMVYEAPEKPGLLSWLFFGAGVGPGEQVGYIPTDAAKAKGKKAVKCDACIGLAGGPACVRACPTGAALRLGPEQFINLVEERKR